MTHYLTLRPEDLNLPEIQKAAAENRVMLIIDDEDLNRKEMVRRIMPYIRYCEPLLNPAYNMRAVREYIVCFVQEEYDYCCQYMASSDKHNKFLCHLVGALLGHHVLLGSAMDLARLLNLKGILLDTRKRYINEGRNILRYHEIFLLRDTTAPNYPG